MKKYIVYSTFDNETDILGAFENINEAKMYLDYFSQSIHFPFNAKIEFGEGDSFVATYPDYRQLKAYIKEGVALKYFFKHDIWNDDQYETYVKQLNKIIESEAMSRLSGSDHATAVYYHDELICVEGDPDKLNLLYQELAEWEEANYIDSDASGIREKNIDFNEVYNLIGFQNTYPFTTQQNFDDFKIQCINTLSVNRVIGQLLEGSFDKSLDQEVGLSNKGMQRTERSL